MRQLLNQFVLALAICWIVAGVFLSSCTVSYAVAYKAINGDVVRDLNRTPAGN